MRKFSKAELELAPKVAEVMDPDGPRILSCPKDMLSNWIRANYQEYDCLEFLCGRCDTVKLIFHKGAWACRCRLPGGALRGLFGKTSLEALYHCIISVGSDA